VPFVSRSCQSTENVISSVQLPPIPYGKMGNLFLIAYEVLESGLCLAIFRPYSKSKLELESNLKEIYQLNPRLSVILPHLNETKLKLEDLKSGFNLLT